MSLITPYIGDCNNVRFVLFDNSVRGGIITTYETYIFESIKQNYTGPSAKETSIKIQDGLIVGGLGHINRIIKNIYTPWATYETNAK